MSSSKAKHRPSLFNFLIFTISKFQIMKKTYISPETLIEWAEPQSVILATSNPIVGISTDDDVDAGDVDVKEDFSDFEDDDW